MPRSGFVTSTVLTVYSLEDLTHRSHAAREELWNTRTDHLFERATLRRIASFSVRLAADERSQLTGTSIKVTQVRNSNSIFHQMCGISDCFVS